MIRIVDKKAGNFRALVERNRSQQPGTPLFRRVTFGFVTNRLGKTRKLQGASSFQQIPRLPSFIVAQEPDAGGSI
jgi:hypothetical protein